MNNLAYNCPILRAVVVPINQIKDINEKCVFIRCHAYFSFTSIKYFEMGNITDWTIVIMYTFFYILLEGLHFTQEFLLQELWQEYNMGQRSISGQKLCELCNLVNLYNLNLHSQLTQSILRALCLFTYFNNRMYTNYNSND